MATIDHLLDRIPNPELRFKLQSEIARLQNDKRFGLIFEEHFPDATLLYEVEVRRGQKVTLKDEPLKEKFEVVNLCNGIAECVSLDEPEHTENIAVDELVSYSELDAKASNHIAVDKLMPFADFGDPIYPYLQSIDKISTAPDSPLWHEIIEADNYHALQLLTYLYPRKVDCIYIDPPYNTGARDWKYNNDYVDSNDAYRHSKWLSMMKKRLLLAKKLLNPADSVLIVTIDEKEYVHLGALLEEMFSNANIQMVSSNIAQKGVARGNSFYRVNEFIFIVQFGKSCVTPLVLHSEWQFGKGESAASKGIVWSQLRRSGTNDLRIDRENLIYPIFFNKEGNRILEVGEPLPLSQHPSKRLELDKDKLILWPIKDDGTEGNWQLSNAELRDRLSDGYVKIGKFKETNIPVSYLKRGSINKIINEEVTLLGRDEVSGTVIVQTQGYTRAFVPGSQWNIQSHDATYKGTQLLSKFITNRFDYPKSLYAVHDTLRFFVANKPNALIVDFFAGSGTTLHAVNLLNAEDGGNRRCIMVTNNEVGDTEERRLKAEGKTPVDKEWIDLGIARYVTWPRTVASITGNDVNGKPISGEYLTYLTQEKESTRRFKKVSYVRDIESLPVTDLKELVSNLSEGKIAKNKVAEDTRYIIDEDSDISLLLDDNAAADWLDDLEGAEHVRTFVIVTQNNKLFNSLKRQIGELLGPIKTTEPQTLPMADGFKANVEFFHLGFLDKRAVERNRQFREILPLLWLKAGGIGECPKIVGNSLPPYLVLRENKFAVLIDEDAFFAFEKEVNSTSGIEAAFIITDSEKGYKEMLASLKVKTCYQLYRDYLDNFKINYTR